MKYFYAAIASVLLLSACSRNEIANNAASAPTESSDSVADNETPNDASAGTAVKSKQGFIAHINETCIPSMSSAPGSSFLTDAQKNAFCTCVVQSIDENVTEEQFAEYQKIENRDKFKSDFRTYTKSCSAKLEQ